MFWVHFKTYDSSIGRWFILPRTINGELLAVASDLCLSGWQTRNVTKRAEREQKMISIADAKIFYEALPHHSSFSYPPTLTPLQPLGAHLLERFGPCAKCIGIQSKSGTLVVPVTPAPYPRGCEQKGQKLTEQLRDKYAGIIFDSAIEEVRQGPWRPSHGSSLMLFDRWVLEALRVFGGNHQK